MILQLKIAGEALIPIGKGGWQNIPWPVWMHVTSLQDLAKSMPKKAFSIGPYLTLKIEAFFRGKWSRRNLNVFTQIGKVPNLTGRLTEQDLTTKCTLRSVLRRCRLLKGIWASFLQWKLNFSCKNPYRLTSEFYTPNFTVIVFSIFFHYAEFRHQIECLNPLFSYDKSSFFGHVHR